MVAGLRSPKRRSDWRLGRWTAKQALRAHPELGLAGVPLPRLEIRANKDGVPHAWHDGVGVPCRLSLSHSGDAAVCAVAVGDGVAVGCDLELVEERSEAFLSDYFTAPEQAWAHRGDPAQRGERATLLWSAKESALKALEKGLSLDTREVEATVAEHVPGGWRPLRVVHRPSGRVFAGWWRRWEGRILTVVSNPATEEEPRELPARSAG